MVPEHAAPSDMSVATDIVHALEWTASEPRLAEGLAIDTDPARRLIIPEKCEAEGEQELRVLARTAGLEEAFAFLPDHCTWIEVGLDQTSTSVRIERGIIDRLVERFGKLVVYHLHPSGTGGAAGEFPAYSDLVGTILINGRYMKDVDIEILHRAITTGGTFQYAFEPSEAGAGLVDLIFSSGLGRFAGENLLLSYAGPEHEGSYYDAIRRCPAFAAAEGAQLGSCFPMRAGDFVLHYRQDEDGDR